jgi:hypothetical protein
VPRDVRYRKLRILRTDFLREGCRGGGRQLLGAFDREIDSDDTNEVDFGAWQ